MSWSGRLFDHQDIDGAVTYITELNASGARGIYLRATSIRDDATIEPGKERGGADISASLPGLWADIDLTGPGHKHTPNRPDLPGYDPRKRIVHPLPASEQQVHQILMEAGLPQPSYWLHSGGGLYPWWILDEPQDLATDPMELPAVSALSANWQSLLGDVFEQNDLHYGTGVGDLARVLRIPGTVNGKVPDQPTLCRPYQEFGNGPTYDLAILEEALTDLQAGHAELAAARRAHWAQQKPQEAHRATVTQQPTREYQIQENTPLNDYERAVGWDEILGKAGWTLHHTGSDGTMYWTRPGKERNDGLSATTNNAADRDRMWCFSDAAGLPVQEPMTKGFVYAQLYHGGDMSAAASALRQRGFGAQGTDWTPPQNPGEWVHIPAEPQEQDPVVGTEFPVDCLTPVLRNMVQSIEDHIQVAPDPAALAALSSVAALVGHKYQVAHTQCGWYQPLILQTMTVMGSGERKSPIMKQFTSVFDSRERVIAAKHHDLVQAKIDQLDLQRGADTLRGESAAANRIEAQIKDLTESLNTPPRITLETDVTAEALAVALTENDGHGAILDGEGSVVGSLLLGRYSPGVPNVDIVLEGYDASSYRVRRKGTGSSRIDRTCLSLGVMTQRNQWNKLATNEYLVDKGLLARMLLAAPASRIGTRDLRTAKPMDKMVLEDWRNLVIELDNLPSPQVDEQGDINVPVLALSEDAANMFSDYFVNHDQRMTPAGDLCSPSILEWSSKHCGRILRIAGLLHLAAGLREDTEIPLATMVCAIRIGEWSIGQAVKLLAREAEDPKVASVDQAAVIRAALERLAKKPSFDPERGVSVRELSKVIHAPWARKDTIMDALDQFAEQGMVRQIEVLDSGNRPRQRFVINPSVLANWGL